MIPARFEYHRPKDLPGVLAILEEYGDDARVMAGGHSLIPMMKLRMAEVPHLIDLQDVGGLSGISVGDTITIGAMTTRQKSSTTRALRRPRRSCAKRPCRSQIRRCAIWERLAAMSPMATRAMTCLA